MYLCAEARSARRVRGGRKGRGIRPKGRRRGHVRRSFASREEASGHSPRRDAAPLRPCGARRVRAGPNAESLRLDRQDHRPHLGSYLGQSGEGLRHTGERKCVILRPRPDCPILPLTHELARSASLTLMLSDKEFFYFQPCQPTQACSKAPSPGPWNSPLCQKVHGPRRCLAHM